jgi:hypothetical protein
MHVSSSNRFTTADVHITSCRLGIVLLRVSPMARVLAFNHRSLAMSHILTSPGGVVAMVSVHHPIDASKQVGQQLAFGNRAMIRYSVFGGVPAGDSC